jgi:hypothetical protein
MAIHHTGLLVLLLASVSMTSLAEKKSVGTKDFITVPPRTIEWTDLMPEEDLQLLMNMPQVDHAGLSEEELAMDRPTTNNQSVSPTKPGDNSALEDQVTSAIEQAMTKPSAGRTWQDALTSTRVRPEFNNTRIRLAGYIVPLEFDDNQVISSFFLVPYFGACIHVPPPPPNQLIYVDYPKGFTLDDLYTPYWLTGTLKIESKEHEMGLAAYSMKVDSIVEYTEE